jgi:LytR cell envelope-related transcriptional attenuator
MTDLPEGSGQVDRGTGRRPPRVGDSGSPVGSTLSIVLAVVAVVAGFLILRAVFEEDDGGSSGLEPPGSAVTEPDTTTPASNGSAPTTVAPTTTQGRERSATIVVANASGIDGSAGQMTTALEAVRYRLGEPTDSSEGQMDNSVIFFVRGDRDARDTAESVARDMGGLRVQRMPDEPPITGELGNATVLVMLGTDAAGKTLAELNPTQVTAPSVAGTTSPPTTG